MENVEKLSDLATLIVAKWGPWAKIEKIVDHENCRDHTHVIMEIYDPKNLDHTKFRDHTHQIIPVVRIILIGSGIFGPWIARYLKQRS